MRYNFGDNLKKFREEMNLNQQQFAELVGTSQSRISRWELNIVEPSLRNVVKILKALQISFEELIEFVEFD